MTKIYQGNEKYNGSMLFPQPSRLNVVRNDSESWDYTNPSLGKHVWSDITNRDVVTDCHNFGMFVYSRVCIAFVIAAVLYNFEISVIGILFL